MAQGAPHLGVSLENSWKMAMSVRQADDIDRSVF